MRRRPGAVQGESFGSGDHKKSPRVPHDLGALQDTHLHHEDADNCMLEEDEESKVDGPCWYLNKINILLGLAVMCAVGYYYMWYLYTLHENRLWFTNIMEVEREISFRTEAGLYYSYYKQMVQAQSFWEGWHSLQHDNTTESWRTINVLNRFNIYQEVLLSLLYRYVPFLSGALTPIFFYIHFIFALHGLYLMVLYGLAWSLGNSWLSGLLASAFFVCNRVHTTRVDFTIPLRESFSIPVLYMQLYFVTLYLRSSSKDRTMMLNLVPIFLSTICFTVTWQFSQFILLLQGMSLYVSALLGIIPSRKAWSVILVIAMVIPVVAFMQFNNTMLKTSLVQSFALAASMELWAMSGIKQGPGFVRNLASNFCRVVITGCLSLFFYLIAKNLIGTADDQHIFRFMLSKFGLSNESHFDVLLYTCNSAFNFMPWSTVEELTGGIVFVFYLPTMIGLVLVTMVTVCKRWRSSECQAASRRQYFITSHPDLCYHAIQSALFGIMAAVVMRMKYVWTPQACVIAAFGISCRTTWRAMLAKVGLTSRWKVDIIRNSAVAAVLAILLLRSLPNMQSELEVLREFYDPDTVELMQWINEETPKDSSFSGSMQLLAGVKLCTGRKLTNHPHFEDKMLRNVTFQLYQFYSKQSVEEVHSIHSNIGTDFIILEGSICLARSNEGCRLIDIIDVINSKPLDSAGGVANSDAGSNTSRQRFCSVIKMQAAKHVKYFKKVFQNKTFHVYQVMSLTKTERVT